MNTDNPTAEHDQDPAEPKSPAQIEAEIAATRAELSQTVDALSAKLDVKSQAQQRVAAAKGRAQTTLEDPGARAEALRRAAPVLAGVGAVAVATGLLRRVAHR
ncbi:MAG: DUF3618 domain-containing protein [Ornithinimicrobium sp.]